MGTSSFSAFTAVVSLLAFAGCATSPQDVFKRQEMEADVDDILSLELDETDFGGPRTCLSDHEYRNFRPLGDRHLLFEGRDGKQWVNVLRGRCHNLKDDSLLIMKKNLSRRLCDTDHFDVADRIDLLQSQAGMAPTCVLGEFKPVARAQLEEIEYRLEMR